MKELKSFCIDFFELEEEDITPERVKEALLIIPWLFILLTGLYFFIGSL